MLTNRARIRFNPNLYIFHSNRGNSGLRQEKGEASSTRKATWYDALTGR